MKDLFTYAPHAMVLVNPYSNRVLQLNQEAQRLLGISQSESQNFAFSDLFPDCMGQLLAFTDQVLDQGRGFTAELSVTVEGKQVQLDVEAQRVDGDVLFSCCDSADNFNRFFQTAAELEYRSGLSHWCTKETVFEEIERQNQLLLNAMGDGIYGVDADGRATFVNDAAEEILGWRREDLIGKKIHDIIHHTHTDGCAYHVHDCPIYAAFSDGKVHRVDDEVFWTPNGTAVPVEYISTPVTADGVLVGAVVIFRDITERKAIEKELMDALTEVDLLKRRLEMENAYLLEELNADFNHHRIVGQSAEICQMVQQIELVGATDANVLIIGESGTGKELIARTIHEVSNRRARPLIRVNCAAVPAELFESEFFGHVKGAFTGAISERIGRFELADGATIFLDEVGEIPLSLQGKLLRVLQEQQFERVGESRTRHVDVRVISATNQDLKKLVKEKKFREDLYFRLNVFPLHSPPLRDRLDDLPLLVKHFITKVCKRIKRPEPKISQAQMQLLLQYHWPGNIRELENIIERQIILARGNRVSFDFLASELEQPSEAKVPKVAAKLMSHQEQKALEKTNIEQALRQCKGKIYSADGAAELLGLKPTTLASKIKKYKINRLIYK